MHDCWCFFADIDPFMNGYTEENDMKKRCEGIISRIISPDKADNNILFNMDIWDWSQGVALYGMYKYYRLTGKGAEQLAYKEKEWRHFTTAVDAVLGFAVPAVGSAGAPATV